MKKEPMISVPRKHLFNLHAAARGMYSQLLQINYGVDQTLLTYMHDLNEAINVGHQLLSTDRASADNYVDLMKQVHEAQLAQVQAFLDIHKDELEKEDNLEV